MNSKALLQLFCRVVSKRRILLGPVLATGIVFCAEACTSESTVVQEDRTPTMYSVAGTVTDLDDHPLPSALVILYRDSTALEERWTDLQGQFEFADVVDGVSHWLIVTAAGFLGRSHRLSSLDSALAIRLPPQRTTFDGSRLALEVGVSVVHPSGFRWQDGDSLFVGEPFTIVVTSYGTGECTKPGPVRRAVEGNELRIAVSDYHDPGMCNLSRISLPRSVRHAFPMEGTEIVRVVSGIGEQVIRFPVYRRSPGGAG